MNRWQRLAGGAELSVDFAVLRCVVTRIINTDSLLYFINHFNILAEMMEVNRPAVARQMASIILQERSLWETINFTKKHYVLELSKGQEVGKLIFQPELPLKRPF